MESTVANPKHQLLESLKKQRSVLADHFAPLVQSAQDALLRANFPTTRIENWKYTRTTRISNTSWKTKISDAQPDLSGYLIPGIEQDVAVFINGHFHPELSNYGQSGIEVSDIRNYSGQGIVGSGKSDNDDLFTALNTAHCTGGIFFGLRKNQTASRPLHILLLSSGEETLSLPRIAGNIESGASAEVIISVFSLDGKKTFTNAVVEAHIHKNAQLRITKIQAESDENFSLFREHFCQEADSRFTIVTATADGGWVRNDLQIRLDGTNCETHLNGFYLPRRNQHVDNHTLVDHLLPHCQSNESYRGVLFDRGRGVFNGKVYVRTDAQKTNAYQNNANIMMSDDAVVNTKPELEIYADDVKCSHGTTTGQMDEKALFYLRARGIGEASARKLLISAFIGEIIDTIENPSIQDHVRNLLLQRDLLAE